MEPKRDERQNSSIESVYMSSDDADSMRETRLEVRGRRRSSSVDSINKSSDSAPLSENAQGETSDVTSSIKVTSLPSNVSEDLITDFFENSKRSGGGDVEYVAYDETKKTAIITFQNPTVVENVLKKHKTKPLTIDEMQLQIKQYHKKTDESKGLVMAVKVTNLPPKIRKLQIELFFESPKKSGSGNGDLEKVDYDEAANCAIVWFKESEVVRKVLEKHKTSPFTLNKQKVEVEEYRPGLDENKSSCAIKISNIPPETTEEELVLFFENRKRSGGDDVENVNYDRSTHTAVIWFKEEDAVKRVLEKTHKLDGVDLTVKRYQFSKLIANRTLVEGLNPEISKDGIRNYLEGKSKEDVVSVTYKQEEGTAMVIFDPFKEKRGIRHRHTSATRSSRDHFVIVAIHFGTASSGYAYSFYSDFSKDKTDYLNRIYIKNWKCGEYPYETIPTTLLLDKDKKSVSFGYNAEYDYSRMSEEEKKEHYYFRRFMMMLDDKDGKLKLTRNTVLIDIRGKKMPAIDVLTSSIKYLKDDILTGFKERNLQDTITPLNKNVTWILTVPAIWDEPGKQFMKEAAERAGIPQECLLLCFEPQAAAVYCKWIHIERERDNEALNALKPGRRFLVLDAEGWKIGMTIQEMRDDGEIREIIKSQECDLGGNNVNEEFKKMMEDIVSKPILEAFRMEYPDDYIALFQHFERNQRQKQTGKIVCIRIPASLLEMTDDIVKCIEDHGLKDEVELRQDKLLIKIRKYEEILNKALDEIVVKVKTMLVSDTGEGTKIIIMVGEFSGCELLQRRIKDSFPSCTVVIPEDCGLAILNGAVLYGLHPGIVAANVVKYTYGVDTYTRFIEDEHEESKKKIINGIEYCTNKFDIFVNKGTPIHCNEETVKTYLPMYENQTSFRFGVFASNAVKPQYTDDIGCKLIGSLTVPMPNKTGGSKRRVMVKFKFGATKITVKGFDETSKKFVDAKIDFLE